jgi:hypothetical protein
MVEYMLMNPDLAEKGMTQRDRIPIEVLADLPNYKWRVALVSNKETFWPFWFSFKKDMQKEGFESFLFDPIFYSPVRGKGRLPRKPSLEDWVLVIEAERKAAR